MALAEGILNRLVRTQLSRGPEKRGSRPIKVRIDNASPMILNGLAVVGTENKADESPRCCRASPFRHGGA